MAISVESWSEQLVWNTQANSGCQHICHTANATFSIPLIITTEGTPEAGCESVERPLGLGAWSRHFRKAASAGACCCRAQLFSFKCADATRISPPHWQKQGLDYGGQPQPNRMTNVSKKSGFTLTHFCVLNLATDLTDHAKCFDKGRTPLKTYLGESIPSFC